MSARALQPLARLRLRLTAWYLATFCLILMLLMGGLFVVIRHQLSEQLDDSLREATTELMRAARIREMEMVSAHGSVMDAVDELHIPDRALYLLDTLGRPVKPADAPEWVQRAARDAAANESVDLEKNVPHDRSLRLHAERFTVDSGKPYVAVAVADRVELEDRYAALIGAFAGAAIIALVLVAGGGYVLVRKSTAPVEHTMESMRRFMADAAHELRTPITVLRSRAEVALQRPRDPAQDAEALRGVERESERLSRIVDDLLILARADAGERQPRRERIYLDDIADDVASAARALAEPCGVTVAIETFEEAVVLGDPDLIRQLLMIILDNAVKYTPPGGRVAIGVSAPQGRAIVEVRDTGIGIPPELLPHIFDRFYRGDPARARVPSTGAGLGLAIARWIAEVHGATIDIASDVGRGTLVAVRFPLPV